MSTNVAPEETEALCPFCEKPIEKPVLQKREVEKQMGSVGVGYPN
jgi:hypothetical protein